MPAAFWWSWSVLVMTTAIEFSMTIWCSDVLQNHDGLSKGAAATGVTAIVTGMTIGRLSSSRLTLRQATDRLLAGVFALTVIGFALFWITALPVLAYAGLFVVGLGISLQFPLAITRLIGFSEGRPDLATGYGSIGTGLAVAIAPFALGAFADRVGSHTAMLVVPVFAVVGTLALSRTWGKTPTPRPTVAVVVGELPQPTS